MFSAKDLFFTPAATGAFTVAKSLRFRSGSSTYLNRTFSTPTSTSIWTFSAWIKRGGLTGTYRLFGASTTTYLTFNSSDQINLTINGVSAATSTAVFRDPSAWYHIVYQQNGSAQTIYVNNQSVATGTTAASVFNTAIAHQLGAANTTNYFDGYMAEVYFVDGQALTPSSFGETTTSTGVWSPKSYTGTYGTNGFYLKFTDVGATSGSNAGYGKDFAGTNYWTTNNFGTTSTATTYDSMYDTPTNYDNGVTGAGNYSVFNPLDIAVNTASNGNLTLTNSSASYGGCRSTIAIPASGKWYWETNVTAQNTSAGSWFSIGMMLQSVALNQFFGGVAGVIYYGDRNDASSLIANGTSTVYSGSAINFVDGDVLQCAYDVDSGKFWFGKNNAWFNSSAGTTGDPSTGANPTLTAASGTYFPFVQLRQAAGTSTADINFGQRPLAYTAPSSFKALCTQNLPTPTIGATSSTLASAYFNIALDTGANIKTTSQALYTYYLEWIKDRANVNNHQLADTVRGNTAILQSNTTAAETTYTAPTGNSVGWVWNAGTTSGTISPAGTIAATGSANVTAGFSVVTWTGNGTAGATVGHGLGVAPKLIISKMRSAVNAWLCYSSVIGAGQVLYLSNTNAATADTATWNNTAPTSSVFTVGNANTNQSTTTYVAYCFAEVAGYSKFGSYTGNGSADGPFVYCGFRPRYILTKRTDSTGNWEIYDTSRDTYNVMSADLSAESSAAETSTARFDALSNGFKIRTTGAATNASGGTYIFAVFAETPFNYSRGR